MHFAVKHFITLVFTASGLTFLAELPDKTMISSVLLSRTFSRSKTFVGASAALVTHSFISAYLGGLLGFLSAQSMHYLVAGVFFLLSGILIFRVITRKEESASLIVNLRLRLGERSQVVTTFVITFVAEIGDLTQVTTAALSARYRAPFPIALGASVGLILAVLVAVNLSRLLDRIPEAYFELVAAVGMGLAGIISLF